MNKKIIAALGILLMVILFVFFFFKNLSNKEKKMAVVNQGGLYGKVTLYEGNCMPGMNKCQISNVARTIYIRKPAEKEAINDGYLKKKTELVKEVKSDKNGKYQVELPNGEYSVFVKDDRGEYCDRFNEMGGTFTVEVRNNFVKYDIQINHAVW